MRHPYFVEGPFVLLAVSDTGAGMDRATQARIFEPFFTTKEAGKGTGLGLSTVYGIVKQSGGYIDVYSEVGYGTTFKIYFPLLADAGRRLDEESRTDAAPAEEPGAGTILLVEDDDALRELLSRSLKRQGHSVVATADPQEALRMARAGIDALRLLVTDAVMPGMSGPDLAREVARDWPHLPVLFISGYTDDAMLRLGLLKTNQAFLQKPFGPKTFLRRVREVLNDNGISSGARRPEPDVMA